MGKNGQRGRGSEEKCINYDSQGRWMQVSILHKHSETENLAKHKECI